MERLWSWLDDVQSQSASHSLLIALALTIVAFLVTSLLDPFMTETRLSAFYAAVAIAAWLGGWRLGLVTAVLSALLSGFAFLEPEFEVGLKVPEASTSLAAFVIVALLISSLSEQSRRAILRSRDAEKRITILSDASAALVSSLDYQQALRHITELAVQDISDWCTVNLLRADGSIRWHAMAHRDPSGAALLAEIQRRGTVVLQDDHPLARALRGGRPVLYSTVSPHQQAQWGVDEEDGRLSAALQTTSAMVVPMETRGRVLGSINFGRSGGPPFTNEDLALVVTLARRAALAIDNALLYEAAQAAEKRYRNLFEGSEDVIVVIDDERRYLDINPAITRLLGYTREEMFAMRVGDLLHNREQWLATALPAFQRDRVWHGEVELRHKNGRLIPIESRMTRVELTDGWVTVASWRDISERRAVERLQHEFIVMVTHDLKTPLTSIKGLAQLMRRRRAWDEHALDAIVSQSDHLERLINDLLDVARLEAGRLELVRAPLDLCALARSTAAEAQATTARHAIVVAVPETPIVHAWDADRVRQVFLNLLTNAIKYSPNGGEIVVTVADDPAAAVARVTVRDNGVGIAPDALPRLFNRFFRVDETLASGEGLGLGLYITRSLVEAHGGQVEAASTPGAGSAFTFTLPHTH